MTLRTLNLLGLSASFNSLFVSESDISKAAFKLHVRGLALEDYKVFWGIIVFVAIYVMNNFATFQWPSNLPFSNDSVKVFSANPKVVFGGFGFVFSAAINRAISASAFIEIGLANIEKRLAVFAIVFLSRLSRDGIARLRTPTSSTRFSACFACVIHAELFEAVWQ